MCYEGKFYFRNSVSLQLADFEDVFIRSWRTSTRYFLFLDSRALPKLKERRSSLRLLLTYNVKMKLT